MSAARTTDRTVTPVAPGHRASHRLMRKPADIMSRPEGRSFGREGRVQGMCGDECGTWPVGAVLGLAMLAVPVGPVRPASASVRSRRKRRPTAWCCLPSLAIRWAGGMVRAARRAQTRLMFRPGRHARRSPEAAVPPDRIGVPANGGRRLGHRHCLASAISGRSPYGRQARSPAAQPALSVSPPPPPPWGAAVRAQG